MPLYEYKCGVCGQVFELVIKHIIYNDDDEKMHLCPKCDAPMKRQIGNVAVFRIRGKR